MTDPYERVVDDLLAAIRTHLQHQHDRSPTDAAVAAYISRSTPTDMYHDLRQYPECRTPARQLKGGRSNTSHVLYVMLWGAGQRLDSHRSLAQRGQEQAPA